MRKVEEKNSYHDFNMTHEQIAKYFNSASRASIGQLEKQALRNFRIELEKRGITLNDLLWR
jgi:DNA-directed RNA polymerase sigma subunit (sigma70/sigma32)